MDFWSKLLDTSDFPARWHCGHWTEPHGWLHIVSDLAIWSAYFAIPCVLLFFFLRRKDLPFRKLFFLFGAFILLCGTTHLMEAIIFWWPAYRLAGVIKFFTAVVSWGTVFVLVRIVPKAMTMRSPDELEREIAARNQLEEALQRANVELESRVQDRTAEISELLTEVKQANLRKDQFLALLAHEIRNPLAPICMGLEVMKMAQGDLTTVENVRSMMERQSKQLVALVDDLLDVSRITQGKFHLRKCRVKLADVVKSAIEAASPIIHEAGHELTVSIPEQSIFINADPHRLAQVLSNLLNNAAKYTPTGGQLWLTIERQGSDVVMKVKDTGIGIPADELGHIFEMFTQIHTTERSSSGLGIGLTLVKSLVEMHNGTIEVRSDVNQGSEFLIRLPILVESPREEQRIQSKDIDLSTLTKRRVLVVDDNKAAADMLSMVVKALGHEVRIVSDGRQAIETAQEFHPQLILMDLGMPNMNGYEAARYIRQQPWGQQMMLVAVTGWGQDEDKRQTKEAGFDAHLTKPAELSELQALFGKMEKKSI